MDRRRLARVFRNRLAVLGLGILAVFVALAIFGEWVAPYDYRAVFLDDPFTDPSSTYLLGTDNLGRDLLSRIIVGTRYSLAVGLGAVTIALFCGATLGVGCGYVGGRLDLVLMRVVDILLAFPTMLLAISIIAIVGPGLDRVIIAVGVSSAPHFARLGRSVALSVKGSVHIEAARALGATETRILFRHVLPHVVPVLLTQATLRMSTALLTGASLSFLGMGVQPPTPEWGALISQGRQYMRIAPNLVLFPGLAIMMVVFALNVTGDAFIDAMNPRVVNRQGR